MSPGRFNKLPGTVSGKLRPSTLYIRIVVYVAAFVAMAFLAYFRYPTYVAEPNFYAEDGTVFAKNIVDHGFWQALATPFNGYFVAGIYLLEGLAFLLNNLFSDGSILNQAAMLGVVSYGFWAFLATLPMLLFWHDFKRKLWFVPLTAVLALMPMPSFNYAVIGTVGNYKFAFLFIAFLLLIKRLQMAQGAAKAAKTPKTGSGKRQVAAVLAIDIGLIICVFTNATVYLLLPLALLSYWPGRHGISRAFLGRLFKRLFKNVSFIGLLVVYGVAMLQLVYVTLHGVTDLAGYLQEPYQMSKTVEIFLHRGVLFPLDFAFLKYLNDIVVSALFIAVIGALWRLGDRSDRRTLLIALWAILAGTALFVSQRTGVSHLFGGYTASGPDHFFYAQNLIFVFTFVYLLARASERTRWRLGRPVVVIIVTLTVLLPLAHNDFGRSAQLNRGVVGTVWSGAQEDCRNPDVDKLTIPTYPVGAQSLELGRQYCTSALTDYIPPRIALPQTPTGNNYVTVNSGQVTQTFRAAYNNLNGISLFLSTFGGGGDAWYKLSILDAGCRNELRTSTFLAETVNDNSYHDIKFPAITDSRDKGYCFTVTPEKLIPGKPPLAIQLSAPDQYPDGTAHKGNDDLREDVVFDLLYRTNR